jgi:hypothetical protein
MFAYSDCWNPFLRGWGFGAFGFYIGIVLAAIGAAVVFGGRIAGISRKSAGAGPHTE